MLQTINSYTNKYAHSVPSPLDSYVFSFDSLEQYDRLTKRFKIQEVTQRSRNEPDMICRCNGNEDFNETSNYPHVGESSSLYFE